VLEYFSPFLEAWIMRILNMRLHVGLGRGLVKVLLFSATRERNVSKREWLLDLTTLESGKIENECFGPSQVFK
jgi:hypothetical protein